MRLPRPGATPRGTYVQQRLMVGRCCSSLVSLESRCFGWFVVGGSLVLAPGLCLCWLFDVALRAMHLFFLLLHQTDAACSVYIMLQQGSASFHTPIFFSQHFQCATHTLPSSLGSRFRTQASAQRGGCGSISQRGSDRSKFAAPSVGYTQSSGTPPKQGRDEGGHHVPGGGVEGETPACRGFQH